VDLKDKRVLVVGLGRSGVASALFLKDRGARVTVSDTKSPDQLRDEIPMTQQIGASPASRAAFSFRLTMSSFSPKYCRRSEWPMITCVTPTASSMPGEISPV